MSSDPRLLREGHAPTPFTAEQIRDGCPEGRTVTTQTVTQGGSETIRVSRFVDCSEDGAVFEVGGQAHRVAWEDLQAHASFPKESTTISRDVVVTPLGRLRCLRYDVVRSDGIERFWFDENRPGMPVVQSVEANGVVLSTDTVIEDVVR